MSRDLERVVTATHANQVRRGVGDGLQMAVRHQGDPIVDIALGRTSSGDRPLERRTRFPVFSSGKAVAATVVHILADRGQLSLDDRVADHLPAFSRRGKEEVQIVHLLAHEAGIPDHEAVVPLEVYRDRVAAVEAICELPLEWQPGSRGEYHAWTAGVILGEVIQQVTGSPFDTVCRAEVLDPIGMHDTTWARPPERTTGMSTDDLDNQEIIDDVVEGPLGRTVLPCVSMWSTAGDLAAFYQTWLDHGRPPGSCERLWSDQTQEHALQPRHPLAPGSSRRFSPGFFVGHDAKRPWAFGAATDATFGHPGWTNATALCDPEDELVVVALSNRSLEQSRSDARLSELVDVVRQAVGEGSMDEDR